ncbi:hypothetical protein [Halegenticoccus soli]|nr:hypothetical protein [Halegenticoccus soli]
MEPPRTCPNCGSSDSITPRYATGGGWRVIGYRCEACGELFDAKREARSG